MSILLKVPLRANAPRRNLQIISAGSSHTLGLDKNGKAWGWGANNFTQLANGTNISTWTPVSIALYGLNKTFCKIALGSNHSLAIDKNGRVWAWGLNTDGRIGDNTVVQKCYPVLAAGAVKTFCQIFAGADHSLAIDKNGRAWGWGNNSTGQLGNNAIISQRTPVSVLGAIKTFCQISANSNYSMAIDKNGRAWGWGNNSNGQLGDNTIISKRTPVSVAGSVKTFCKIISSHAHSMAIDKNGRLWAWGSNTGGQLGNNTTISQRTPVSVLGAVKTFCKIAANQFASAAIDKNGRLWLWGSNATGELGNNSTISQRTPISLAGPAKTFCDIFGSAFQAANAFLAIDKNGRTWAWGLNSSGRLGTSINSSAVPVPVGGQLKTFCQIAANSAQASGLVVDKNGKIWGWGDNNNGRLGNNTTTIQPTPVSIVGSAKTFCQIAFGYVEGYGIDKNGRAWGWGWNIFGQVGDNTNIERLTPVSIAGAVKTFCKISGGTFFAAAIDKNGRAWGWGYNSNGQIGDNTQIDRLTPISVRGAVKTFCEISCGDQSSAALDKNGRAWTWGVNSGSQLGDNTQTQRLTPVSVVGTVKTFCKISMGGTHCLAIDKNGRAWAWGTGSNGQLASDIISSILTPITITGVHKTFCSISAGSVFSLALDKNGRAWGWGDNRGGQVGDNSTIQRNSPVSVLGAVKTFCKITGGGTVGSTAFSLALDKNGRAWTWGYNGVGQLGNNAIISQRTPVSVAGAVKTFCQISNGVNQAFSLAIDKNGRAWAWGVNGNGNLGNNTIISQRTPVSVLGAVKTFCKVAVGGFHSLAIDKNGRLWAWGNNSNGQLGNNTSANSVLTPVSVQGAIKTFCHIAGGNSQSLAIDKNGQAWGWGFNGSGQTGDGSATDRLTPVSVAGQKKTFCKIASGNGPSFAIDKYGILWAWGFNGSGQIGDNSMIPKRTPVRVFTTRTFCEVKAASNHVLAIEKDGRIWAWGENGNGQIANRFDFYIATPISVRGAVKTFCQIFATNTEASFAIDKNGILWSWGNNTGLRLGINSREPYVFSPKRVYGNKTFCKISGYDNISAIDKNGRVWSWGSNGNNGFGQNSYSELHTTPVRVCVI